MSPEAIRALVAAGVTAEQLGAAVLAEAEAVEGLKAEKRARDAERKRRSRVRDVTRTDVDGDGQTRTDADSTGQVPPEVSPKDNTQTPILAPSGEKTGRAREPDSDWPKDGFRRFYERYPRKKAPADAERAYRKAERTPGLTFAALMAGLDRLIESDPDPGFIPYPASWLNSGSWADEPDPPARPLGSPHVHRPRHDRQSPHDAQLAALGGAFCGGDDDGRFPPDDPGVPRAYGASAAGGYGHPGGPLRLVGSR